MFASRLAGSRRGVLFAVVILLLTGPAPVRAEGLGPLEPYLLLGSDPPWSGAMEAGGYRLTNDAPNTDIVYFVAALPGGRAQEVSVTLQVQGGAGAGYSGAGLIFNFDHNSRNYLALVLTATGELAIYQRGNQGVGELARLPLSGVDAAGPVRLTLHASGQGLAFEANGVHQGSVDGVGLSGQAGILAIDGGSYRFSDYTVR